MSRIAVGYLSSPAVDATGVCVCLSVYCTHLRSPSGVAASASVYILCTLSIYAILCMCVCVLVGVHAVAPHTQYRFISVWS